MPQKKSAAKPVAKKSAAKPVAKKTAPAKTESKFYLPQPGDKVSPANGELAANGQPLVFEVDHATGNEKKNEIVIKPVGNTYTTGQWKLVDSEKPVNY